MDGTPAESIFFGYVLQWAWEECFVALVNVIGDAWMATSCAFSQQEFGLIVGWSRLLWIIVDYSLKVFCKCSLWDFFLLLSSNLKFTAEFTLFVRGIVLSRLSASPACQIIMSASGITSERSFSRVHSVGAVFRYLTVGTGMSGAQFFYIDCRRSNLDNL